MTWIWCSGSRPGSRSLSVAGSCARARPRRSPTTRKSAPSIWEPRFMPESLLQIESVRAGYGDAVVLDDVGFSLEEGQSLTILGRNGMGKTTLILTLMGQTRLFGGTMILRGRRFERQLTNRRVALG